MSVRVRDLTGDWRVVWEGEATPGRRFRDFDEALRFVSRWRHDPLTVTALRSLLAQRDLSWGALRDDALVARCAQLLALGRLRCVRVVPIRVDDIARAESDAHDTIALDDAFLSKVVTEIRQQTPDLEDRGGLLENYLQINRDLRKRNAEELVALAPRTAGAFLWTEPFLPLRNAKVMSSFADQRTYVYQGKDVDAQTHLGFDLAAVARTPVPAANRGVVVLSRYFGIYGNTVVVDHGLGLATLYSHLSSIDVREGETVERGQVLGRTGKTGLAGGDHLHFTTLVRGLPVDPREWWDGAWIRDRVAPKVGPAVLAWAGGARR